jgi:hypothetical protein
VLIRAEDEQKAQGALTILAMAADKGSIALDRHEIGKEAVCVDRQAEGRRS